MDIVERKPAIMILVTVGPEGAIADIILIQTSILGANPDISLIVLTETADHIAGDRVLMLHMGIAREIVPVG